MVVPVPIGLGFPTTYHVGIGTTAGPLGVYLLASLFAVHWVEFLPGTGTANVPPTLCNP